MQYMLINFNNRLIGLLSGAILEKYINHVISIEQQEQKNCLIIKFGEMLLKKNVYSPKHI